MEYIFHLKIFSPFIPLFSLYLVKRSPDMSILFIYWQDYSTEGMSEKLQVFLQHLREFGLVYQRKVELFYFTSNGSKIFDSVFK